MSETPVPLSTLRQDSPDLVKLTDWAKEPSLQDLKADLEAARPSQTTQVAKINAWLDNLNITGGAKFTARKGRSQVQPKLIRKQAEWRYSNLSEPFLSGEDMFTVSPMTFEDTRAAIQNGIVLNWQFRTKIDRVAFVDEFVRTVTDEGTVVVQVGWDREIKMETVDAPTYAYFAPQSTEELEYLQQALQSYEENPASLEEMDPALKESVIYSLENKQPALAKLTGYEKVQQQKVIRNQPTVLIRDVRNVFVDPSCQGDLTKAGFLGLSFETSFGELRKDKRYKNLENVNWDSSSILAEPDHNTPTPAEFQFRDKARKRVLAYEYWGFWDTTGEGDLTPFVATWVGDVMIRLELNPFPDQAIPFVIVPYMPIKKSVYGEPDGALLEDNQKIIGAVTRGMIDLMARSANGQKGMAKGMLDAPNKRKFENGDDYEFNPNANPAQAYHEHKFPEIPQSALAMLQLQNFDAESLTGVKAFGNTGVTGAAFGNVASAAKGAMDAAAKREMAILRRLAKGMAMIGSKIMAMNAEFLSEEEVVRVTNEQFVTVRRDELIGRFDMEVKVATEESNAARAQELGFMLQTMGNNMDFNMTKMILVEIARLRKMPELAKKIEKFEPQPDPMQQQKLQLEILELQSRIAVNEAKVAEINAGAGLKGAQAEKAAAEKDRTNLDYVETETGTKHARDMEKLHAQGNANQSLEVTKAIVNRHKDVEGPTPDKDIVTAVGFNAVSP